MGFSWWGYARCDGRMDREYYEIMAAAGCQGFNYGIETGSDKVLKAINKKNTVAEINQNIIDSHAVGMKVSACWVIGAPGEDIEAFTHSFNMLWNHRERIIACSPGIGLGDNAGSDYDDREKYNINPRNTSFLGGWYTLDLTNTKLHRFIRVKLMHIWLKICKEYGGTIANVHSAQGDITDHYTLTFESEFIKTHVEYEDFDYNIIQSGQGVFADSVMNEVFGFLRMLWRVRGGFEINLNFNKDLDHRDFMSAIVPDTHSYTADIWFKIDDDGNYSTRQQYEFINNFKNIVNTPGFDYTYESSGLWKESKKSLINKIFYIKTDRYENILPIESAFSSISIPERSLIFKTAKKLSPGSCVVEVNASLGGRASIVAQANKTAKIIAIETFSDSKVTDDFASMSSWVEDQLVDGCKQLDQDKTIGIELLSKVRESFKTDTSGKSAFDIITASYSNIALSNTHNSSIDLCIVKNIDDNVSKWAKHVAKEGYMLVYPVDKKSLLLDGWKIIESAQSMSLMQKQS